MTTMTVRSKVYTDPDVANAIVDAAMKRKHPDKAVRVYRDAVVGLARVFSFGYTMNVYHLHDHVMVLKAIPAKGGAYARDEETQA